MGDELERRLLRNMYIVPFFRDTIMDLARADFSNAQGNAAATIARKVTQVCKLQQSLARMPRVVFPPRIGECRRQCKALAVPGQGQVISNQYVTQQHA